MPRDYTWFTKVIIFWIFIGWLLMWVIFLPDPVLITIVFHLFAAVTILLTIAVLLGVEAY